MSVLFSHPGVPLVDHLQQVADGCRQILASKQLALSLPRELVVKLAYCMGAVHDIGKGTAFFQHYLLSPTHEETGPKHHALLSAVVAKELASQLVQKYEVEEGDRQLLPYLVFIAVKRHHGNLQDIEQELGGFGQTAKELPIQLTAIDEQAVQAILDEVLQPVQLTFRWADFFGSIAADQLSDEYGEFFFEFSYGELFPSLQEEQKSRYYYLYHLLYGTLLLADKRDVILERRPDSSPIQDDVLKRYRQSKGFDQARTALNRLQNQAYFGAMAHLEEVFSPAQHLYSITLPTGMGKTLTSLGIGLRLRQKLGLADGRIIVAIPFTSIIDQNFEVYKQVFSTDDSGVLLKHHHLSEPIYKSGQDEVRAQSTAQSQFLIETWDSQVVVTTFVQLIELLFTNDKRKLLKLSQLANSVVILDEVQSIPYGLWPLIRAGIQQVAKMYGTYFVLMSATQPLIFAPEKEIRELIPDYRQYFQNGLFNRTKLINRIEPIMTLEELVAEVYDYALRFPGKDLLVVLNTKKITRDCFLQLRDLLGDENELFFLSTFITPMERKRIIKRITEGSGSKRRIIVSTQLIEAGVDISVDAVFRALAPLDSLIQAAGRANRYGEKTEPAEVIVFHLRELQQTSSLIYGAELLQKTRNVLKGIQVVEESDYLPLIEAYYQEVLSQTEGLGNATLKHLQELEFAKVGEFQLIEERNTESVFVALDEQAGKCWEAYASIYQNDALSFFEKREQFARIKAKFYDYVINVPVKRGADSIEFDGEPMLGFYVASPTAPSSFYAYHAEDWSQNTGYHPNSTLIF